MANRWELWKVACNFRQSRYQTASADDRHTQSMTDARLNSMGAGTLQNDIQTSPGFSQSELRSASIEAVRVEGHEGYVLVKPHRVVYRLNPDQIFSPHFMIVRLFLIREYLQHGKIDLARDQPLLEKKALGHADSERYTRMQSPEPSEDSSQLICCSIFCRPEMNLAGKLGQSEMLGCFIVECDEAFRIGEKAAPIRRGGNSGAGLEDNRATYALFQAREFVTDRRLREVQLLGGARDAPKVYHSLKGAKGVYI